MTEWQRKDDFEIPETRWPMGKWLVENMPRGTNLEIPDDRDSDREVPFIDDDPVTKRCERISD